MLKPRHSRPFLLLAALLLWLVTAPASAQSKALSSAVAPAWTSVSVGVTDLDQALEFWVGSLGFDTLAQSDGDDAELATLWRILPEDVRRQALLGMPGSAHGHLHLVEFSEPGPAVREGAKVNDAGPQSLVVYADDLRKRVKDLQEAGLVFFSADPVEISQPDGIQLSEIRLGVHDEVSVILRELHGAELAFNARGFSGIAGLVNVVEFARPEVEFLANALGWQPLAESTLEGTGLELLMGQATGAVIETTHFGSAADAPGQLQLDDWRHASPGENLYPVAVPTQVGILHASYATSHLETLQRQLHAAGFSYSDREFREVIYGSGRFIRFRAPSGMTFEAFE